METKLRGERAASRIADALGSAALAVILLFALALSIGTLFYSAHISTIGELPLSALYEVNERTYLILVLCAICALMLLVRVPVNARVNRVLALIVFGAYLIAGIVWVLSVSSYGESDTVYIKNAIVHLLAGDTAALQNTSVVPYLYFTLYPYQFGFMSVLEGMIRLFGLPLSYQVFRVLNVVLTVSAYYAVLKLTRRVFHDERVVFLTLLLLAGCTQPILACTFVYGLLPAFALSAWGVYLFVAWMQDGGWLRLVAAALLLVFSVYLKTNTYILLLALGLVCAVQAVRAKRVLPLVVVVLIALCSLPAPRLIQKSYEARTDATYGTGYPLVYWAGMSANEDYSTTGWYSHGYSFHMLTKFGADTDGVAAEAKKDVAAHFRRVLHDPEYFSTYYSEKLLSQWAEPTFFAFRTTMYPDDSYGEQTALEDFVYSDDFDAAYGFVEGAFLKLLYALFALGCAVLLFSKRSDLMLFMPILIVGGILFHLIFEAKSQYVLSYLSYFCPIGAYGACRASDGAQRFLARCRRQLNSQKTVRN